LKHDVYVTGLGVVSPIGSGIGLFWENLLAGRHAFHRVSSFDTDQYPHHIGSEIRNYVLSDCISKAEKKIFGRATSFAIDAAYQAIADANFGDMHDLLRHRFGVVVGTTFGEAQIIESAVRNQHQQKRIPRNIKQYSPNSLSVNLAKKFKLRGPNFVVPTACAAGNYAVGYGAYLISIGAADLMLVGGADPFSHVSFSGFSRLGVMATSVCQPFDKNRKGMIVGEGAGMLILERGDIARQRNAKKYAKIMACGYSCDATHMTIPDSDGVKAMMVNALNEAGVTINDVDYICAHGTGTHMNDKTESGAIRQLFYDNSLPVPVSSIKSVLGHTMGAASAIEAIACCLAIKDQVIPPTINFEAKDPNCDIDCVPNIPRKKKLRMVLNNALAFGGNNASLLIGEIS